METLPREEAVTFFRDVTTFQTLSAILIGQTATMAPLLPRVVSELVGPLELAEFSLQYAMLGLYTWLHALSNWGGVTGLRQRARADYALSCALDALAYGSGLDGATPREPPPGARAADAKQGAAPAGNPVKGAALAADGTEQRPWWRRPPPNWPPRIDDPWLVFGDVLVVYASAYAAVDAATTGQGAGWQTEGAVLTVAWLLAAAWTNAWDPTAVLPSLGLRNTIGCVARTAIDLASCRVSLALISAIALRQAVDVSLLTLELVLSASLLAVWRSLYMATNPDQR